MCFSLSLIRPTSYRLTNGTSQVGLSLQTRPETWILDTNQEGRESTSRRDRGKTEIEMRESSVLLEMDTKDRGGNKTLEVQRQRSSKDKVFEVDDLTESV